MASLTTISPSESSLYLVKDFSSICSWITDSSDNCKGTAMRGLIYCTSTGGVEWGSLMRKWRETTFSCTGWKSAKAPQCFPSFSPLYGYQAHSQHTWISHSMSHGLSNIKVCRRAQAKIYCRKALFSSVTVLIDLHEQPFAQPLEISIWWPSLYATPEHCQGQTPLGILNAKKILMTSSAYCRQQWPTTKVI